MQKLTKKLIAFLACTVLVLSMALAVFAESKVVREDGFSSMDGLEITVSTDSDKYNSGEAVEYTVSFKNTNDYDLDVTKVDYKFPEGIEYSANSTDLIKAGDIGLVKAGDTVTRTFSTDGEKHKNSNLGLVIGIIAAVVVIVVVLIVVLMMKGKKGKKATAAILAGVLLASAMSTGFSQEVYAVTAADFNSVGVHDPSIVKDPDTGTYYIFGSHMAFAKTDDLMKWQTFSLNINTQYEALFGELWKNYVYSHDPEKYPDDKRDGPPQLNGNLWAPDVIWNPEMNKWCMYMSVNGRRWHSAIVLLTADNIEGPYEYVDEVIFSGAEGSTESTAEASIVKADKTVEYNGSDAKMVMTINFEPYSDAVSRAEYSDLKKVLGLGEGDAIPPRYTTDPVTTGTSTVNCIDPNVQYDDEGNLWMTYGSWSAGIFQIKLDNKTGLRDYEYEYGEYVKDKVDPYLGYKIAGGYYNSGEAPYLLKADKYYYLFVSLGNLETSGGYNMRIFRSENINGPYVDQDGHNAIYTAYDPTAGIVDLTKDTKTTKYNSVRGIRAMSSIRMYGKSDTHIEAAQGHNSAFVDDDGKIYLVYHTRYSDTAEQFWVRVHQMYVNEDGWLVVSPYEYSGESITETGFGAAEIAGNYDFSIQYQNKVFVANSKVDDTNGIYDAVQITLGADGTISGGATGTWKTTTGSNVEMVIDGVTYKGVFVKQANETERAETLTFTLCGGNQLAWGAKLP